MTELSNNFIRFTDIPDTVHISPNVDAKLNSTLSDIVDYVSKNFNGSRKYKINVINLINTVSYMIANGDSFDGSWNPSHPFDNIDIVDDKTCKETLKSSYIEFLDVYWDIDIVSDNEDIESKEKTEEIVHPVNVMKITSNSIRDKEDLYIQSPTYPRFDVNSVWLSGEADGNQLVIYETLPKVPTRQCEISVTTDVNRMSQNDLIRLYPSVTVQTRYDGLYDKNCELYHDDVLGCILPISVFSEDDVIENVIQYPHFFKLKKMIDGKLYNFYSTIEIDGQLYKTMDIWDSLPEAKVIPRNIDFIKDYVVRRYLLERDVLHIEHKYPMYGDLSPYLTLFTTLDNYVKFDVGDPVEIARQCVISRVKYKQSRNPIIRRLSKDA